MSQLDKHSTKEERKKLLERILGRKSKGSKKPRISEFPQEISQSPSGSKASSKTSIYKAVAQKAKAVGSKVTKKFKRKPRSSGIGGYVVEYGRRADGKFDRVKIHDLSKPEEADSHLFEEE